LAGESSADEVRDFDFFPIDFSDVAEVGDARPMLPEDGTGVGVELALPDGFEATCFFEAKLDSADS
jgi:hypothetical protein